MEARPADRLILFARYPVPGQAKTRLIPALGPEGAARLHRRLTEHAVRLARAAGSSRRVGVTICCTGAPLRDFRRWLGADLAFASQSSGDLGARLRHAFSSAFRGGARRVVVFGADIPDLSPEILLQSFEDLGAHDVVLGPAADGGYYLIGVKRAAPELFSGISWGTALVREQTRAAIGRRGLSVAELPTLGDVDLPGDLTTLREDARFAGIWSDAPRLSVIVPTLNEAAVIRRTLEQLRRASGVEIVVADGGSRDATRDIAAATGADVLVVAGGRAAQLNAGAAASRGSILLFLHADTIVPDDYAALIRRALEDPAVAAGAFSFRTDGSGAALRLVAWGANLRSSLFRWPYGDQGLFMERRVFDELGGFAPLPIMEDFELVSRLRRRGTVVTLDAAAVTSARRWEHLGALRTTVRNLVMIAGFHAGVSPERLARFYRGARDAPPDFSGRS